MMPARGSAWVRRSSTLEDVMGHSWGKVAIVFGGARGIAAATARALHAEGASVVIGDVLTEEGEGTAAEMHATRCRFAPCDVSREAATPDRRPPRLTPHPRPE